MSGAEDSERRARVVAGGGGLVEYEQLPGTAASRTAGNGRVAHEPRRNRLVTS